MGCYLLPKQFDRKPTVRIYLPDVKNSGDCGHIADGFV